MVTTKGDAPENPKQAAAPHSDANSLYTNADMKHPVFNHQDYGPNSPSSPRLNGPKLNDLTIDVPNVHEKDVPNRGDGPNVPLVVSVPNYQKIAQQGTEFIAENGNINLQVKHALDEALQSDKSMNTKHEHVDKLLAYMNENLHGTNFSVLRDGNKFLLLDARDNEHYKPGAKLTFREGWDLDKKSWFDPNAKHEKHEKK